MFAAHDVSWIWLDAVSDAVVSFDIAQLLKRENDFKFYSF